MQSLPQESMDNNVSPRLFCSATSSSGPFGISGSASSSGSGLGSLPLLQQGTAPHETTIKKLRGAHFGEMFQRLTVPSIVGGVSWVVLRC
ncbi:hypothetical protein Tco_0905366 [Tanacetum coccineum]